MVYYNPHIVLDSSVAGSCIFGIFAGFNFAGFKRQEYSVSGMHLNLPGGSLRSLTIAFREAYLHSAQSPTDLVEIAWILLGPTFADFCCMQLLLGSTLLGSTFAGFKFSWIRLMLDSRALLLVFAEKRTTAVTLAWLTSCRHDDSRNTVSYMSVCSSFFVSTNHALSVITWPAPISMPWRPTWRHCRSRRGHRCEDIASPCKALRSGWKCCIAICSGGPSWIFVSKMLTGPWVVFHVGLSTSGASSLLRKICVW